MTSVGQFRTITIISVLLIFGLLTACSGKPKNGNGSPQAEGRGTPTVPVTVATAVRKDMPIEVRAIGSVEPYSTVQVKSMVAGELTEVHFKDGQDVQKGELLFTVDKRPFEAALKQAEANLARDLAQAAHARSQATRYEALLREGVVAKEAADQMNASADALDAAVSADKAAVETAKVNLQYCAIYAPIGGRTGDLMVHAGNLVRVNDVALVTINQITPTYVDFSVPEQFLPDIKKFGGRGTLKVQAGAPGQPPSVGTLDFVDNAVDTNTGTIKLKGVFPNAERRLWPGQFVNVVLTLTMQPGAVVVPTQAVQTGQGGQYVFVVKPDRTAESRAVTLERTVEGEAVIATGVAAGEIVVIDGQMRLSPGAKVSTKSAGNPQSALPQDNGQGAGL